MLKILKKSWCGLNKELQICAGIAAVAILLGVIEYHFHLYHEYGIDRENRSQVTNPENIRSAFVKTLELCQQHEANKSINCQSAIYALERTIDTWDLQSQRSMAKSALGILQLNFLQLLLGALTFAGIIWTIHEARRGADAANRTAEVAENSERAHVLPVVDFVYVGEDDASMTPEDALEYMQRAGQPPARIKPSVHIKNFGSTPAQDVEITVVYEPREYFGTLRKVNAFSKNAVLPPAIQIYPLISMPHDSEDIVERPRVSPDGDDYIVWIKISYKSLFDAPEQPTRNEFIRYSVSMDIKAGPSNSPIAPTGNLSIISENISEQEWEKQDYKR